jgi:hypothetical protein
MNKSFTRGIAYTLLCALVPPPLALAQSANDAPFASSAPAPRALAFKEAELDQMLAPVALYPDALLSQMLMAATYPLEVVQAARWTRQHPGLSGTALRDAVAAEPWDASVKSLCAFPQVLQRMSRDLVWTQKLGDAFLDQQQQVMQTVQNLRTKAEAAGKLQSNERQQVVVEDGDITIMPADPQIVYVPVYDPSVVYGGWWWPTYPPYYPVYWRPRDANFVDGFFWGTGIGAGLALWGGFDWRRHDVNINAARYNYFNRTRITEPSWHFDPAHRHAVPYRSVSGQQHFAGINQVAPRRREEFRRAGRGPTLPAPRVNAAPHVAPEHHAVAPHAPIHAPQVGGATHHERR